MEDESNCVLAYSDGSGAQKTKGVPAPGAWAFCARNKSRLIKRWGYDPLTTVNAMELTGILRVLEYVRPTREPLIIYTDSQYAFNAITNWCIDWATHGWITRTGFPVANKEIVQAIMRARTMHEAVRTVELKWIKGHQKNLDDEHVRHNNLADLLATNARKEQSTNWPKPKPLYFAAIG